MIIDLNLKYKTKNSRRKQEKVIVVLGIFFFSFNFFNSTLKARSIKENIHKLHLITIKYFCSLKDTSKRISKKIQTWEKFVPIKYLITDFVSGYVSNSKHHYEKSNKPIINKEKIFKDTSQKNTYELKISICH